MFQIAEKFLQERKKNIDTIITVCSLNSTQQQQKSLLLSWVDPSTKKKQIK